MLSEHRQVIAEYRVLSIGLGIATWSPLRSTTKVSPLSFIRESSLIEFLVSSASVILVSAILVPVAGHDSLIRR